MKRCPYCDEEVRDNAVKCKHCGSALGHTDADTLDSSVTMPGTRSGPKYDTLDVAVTQGGEATMLAGQYRIIKKIGEGGMGVVYLAEDTRLYDRKVAIKVLPPLLSRNTRAVENLRREALTAIELNHPNIIRLYGFHSDGDIKFLVMEYIDGQTLEEKVFSSETGKLTVDETIAIAGQIAAALDHAHSQNPPVIHRDMKPSNIMVDKQGRVKVLDFGIAREIKDSYTRVTGNDTSGTLPYMSPQQLLGARPEPSMDIYSLAAVTFECLCGHTPFYTGDIRRQIEVKKPDDIIDVPDEINNALQKALSKESKDRPKTAGKFAESLKAKVTQSLPKAVAKVESKQEPPPIKREPIKPEPVAAKIIEKSKPAKSKKGLWVVWVLLFVIVSFIIVVWFSQFGRPSARPIMKPVVEVPNKPQSPTPTVSKPKSGDVITNSIGMKLVYIPAGEFMMGSPSSESDRYDDEGPVHKVHISKGFYMGQTEVTQAQYKAVMGTNPSNFKGDNNPVEQVSWNDATEFCQKLSQKEGKTYTLPTEAQWEYACRAGTKSPFNTGATISTNQANYDGDYTYGNGIKGADRKKTIEVGSFKPNDFDLYDMHGNVWEWCSDWYGKDYYSSSPPVDPEGSGTGSARVLRGGSWSFTLRSCRSASRVWDAPGLTYDDVGFRVVSLDFH